MDPSRDESLIFELLDFKHEVGDSGSAAWFLQDLATEQDAEQGMVLGFFLCLIFIVLLPACALGLIIYWDHNALGVTTLSLSLFFPLPLDHSSRSCSRILYSRHNHLSDVRESAWYFWFVYILA